MKNLDRLIFFSFLFVPNVAFAMLIGDSIEVAIIGWINILLFFIMFVMVVLVIIGGLIFIFNRKKRPGKGKGLLRVSSIIFLSILVIYNLLSYFIFKDIIAENDKRIGAAYQSYSEMQANDFESLENWGFPEEEEKESIEYISPFQIENLPTDNLQVCDFIKDSKLMVEHKTGIEDSPIVYAGMVFYGGNKANWIQEGIVIRHGTYECNGNIVSIDLNGIGIKQAIYDVSRQYLLFTNNKLRKLKE